MEKIPLITLSAVSSLITFLAQRGAIGWTEQLPMSERITNAFVAYVIYIRQMFWPTELAVFYPHPENRLPIWEVSLALIILVGIMAAAFVLRRERLFGDRLVMVSRHACASDWVLQVGWQGHADRYTYLPQIGLYIAVTWALTDLIRSWRFNGRL